MSLRARIHSPEEHGSRGEDAHLVASYRAKLLEEIDLAEMSSLAMAERRARLERVLGHIISREGPVLSTVERSPADPPGSGRGPRPGHPGTTARRRVHHGDHGQRPGRHLRRTRRPSRTTPLRFASNDQLMQTIRRIVSTVNRRVDESNPMVDARLPSGERVNVIIPPSH